MVGTAIFQCISIWQEAMFIDLLWMAWLRKTCFRKFLRDWFWHHRIIQPINPNKSSRANMENSRSFWLDFRRSSATVAINSSRASADLNLPPWMLRLPLPLPRIRMSPFNVLRFADRSMAVFCRMLAIMPCIEPPKLIFSQNKEKVKKTEVVLA